MALSFAEIPTIDERLARARTRAPAASRRAILTTGFTVATAAAFGVLEAVNKGVARAAWDWREVISVVEGPCAPGNYASGHSEAGIPCGPSLRCDSCCHTDASSGSNRTAWHRTGRVGSTTYSHRPDQCWVNVHEAWRWNFGPGGQTWRCSDGYRNTGSGAVKTICPWDF